MNEPPASSRSDLGRNHGLRLTNKNEDHSLGWAVVLIGSRSQKWMFDDGGRLILFASLRLLHVLAAQLRVVFD